MSSARNIAAARQQTCKQIKEMIVLRLDLPIDPEWIADDQPLFGRGLELDSVDTLELVLGLEAEFNVSLTDEDKIAFGSVARLVERILTERPELTEQFAPVAV